MPRFIFTIPIMNHVSLISSVFHLNYSRCIRCAGLFNKAIMQSGSALSPWAMTYDQNNDAEELGDRLGFTGTTPTQLLQFLRTQSGEDLTRHAEEMAEDIKRVNLVYFCIPSHRNIAISSFILSTTEIPWKMHTYSIRAIRRRNKRRRLLARYT